MGGCFSGIQWTLEDDKALLSYAGAFNLDGAVQALNRTPAACQARAYALGASFSPASLSVWTKAEDRRLVELVASGLSLSKAAAQMGNRTSKACTGRLSKLVERNGGSRASLFAAFGVAPQTRKERHGRPLKQDSALNRRRPWTAGDDGMLLKMADEGATAKAIAEALHRLPESVLNRLAILDGMAEMEAAEEAAAQEASVQTEPERFPVWTDAETAELEALFAEGDPVSEIALAVGREQADVRSRIDALGLQRMIVHPSRSRAGQTFSSEEDMAILREYGTEGAMPLADRYGRAPEEISSRAAVIGAGLRPALQPDEKFVSSGTIALDFDGGCRACA